ncbi:hypothetical protein ABW636_18320 [Aquimarina sp. 2201CG1-2-11]|uniref:hypothetical protein n=1 Tax=Aquimarina discodermiae TaxID=3231043 RepID=UPI00346277E4
MTKTKTSHRVWAMVFLLTMLPGILPVNYVFASNNGPKSPEAASFEPVDATDMVNLATGDMSYVLPLLNVPSPEGGYPLSLAYHAGIAMDQEASWVGLGWNLNPGAINRSVNGYPDDYRSSKLSEFFYDEGGQESIYSASLSYTHYGGGSVGLGLSWGSNRSLGGYVSVGYGIPVGEGKLEGSLRIGTNGVGVGVGYTSASGLTLGANASSNGSYGGKAGFNNNEGGYTIGLSSEGTVTNSFKIGKSAENGNSYSLDFSMSSRGASINASVVNTTGNEVNGGAGIGLQTQFTNTLNMGDYSTRSSGWMIPLFIPTKIGVFGASFGKTTFRYFLGKRENNFVYGPMYFSDDIKNGGQYRVSCYYEDYYGEWENCGERTFESYEEASAYASQNEGSDHDDCRCEMDQIRTYETFMDSYEVALVNQNLSDVSKPEFNNAVFPSYDKYNVQAQGLSGGMSSRLYENGTLFGLSNKESNQDFTLEHMIDGATNNVPDHAKFDTKPHFYFDNEIGSFIDVKEANLDQNSNQGTFYAGGVESAAKPRNRNASYIEHFTNDEISNSYSVVKSKGYLKPIGNGFDQDKTPANGIGGFKITSVDGKTYHYSLPVYNHEIVTRTIGVIKSGGHPKLEKDSYFEKRQLEPYATHWLLTAVTGPDFFDTNNNGIADKEDYGYWVNFEYGKWSEAFVWKAPFGKEYIESSDEKDVKTSIRGRKDMYYLDKVATRTHKALFIKKERSDSKSIPWDYKSVRHKSNINQNSSAFVRRFNIPSQNTLRLDRIVLLKESDDNVNPAYGVSNQSVADIYYIDASKRENAGYNLKDNVIDVSDNVSDIIPKAIKVIDFDYDYNLVKGAPNTESSIQGRLSLQAVNFKGKSGVQLTPPYKFGYINPAYVSFDIEDKDAFGYKKDQNEIWSLNEITTPQGGKINIKYAHHNFKPIVGAEITFTKAQHNNDYKITKIDNVTYKIESTKNIGIEIGDQLEVSYDYSCYFEDDYNCNGPCGVEKNTCDFNKIATVTSQTAPLTYLIKIDSFYCSFQGDNSCNSGVSESLTAKYKLEGAIENFGGIRVAEITTTDGGVNSFTSKYNYGENENGIGCISYIPFAPELDKELPYSQELPAPKVMYEYVSMENLDTNNESMGKTVYKFNVLKEKDPDKIKFGNFYEVIKDKTTFSDANAPYNKVTLAKHTIKDNLASIGQLLEVASYNTHGQLMSKITNEYYLPEETPNMVGVTKESYQSYKTIDYTDKQDKVFATSSSRVRYPNLLKSSTEYKANHRYTTEFGKLDEVTGSALETLSTSSKGDELKSRTIPAYHKYPSMGTKVDDPSNKNMLTQQAASYSYLLNEQRFWEPIGVGISTWSNDWTYRNGDGSKHIPTNEAEKIWRKKAIYRWEGERTVDGILVGYDENNDDQFNWIPGAVQTNPKWSKTSEISLYDRYSVPLEILDINGNKGTTKKGDDARKVIAVGNAGYHELFYSGAEYIDKNHSNYFDGEIGSIGRSSDKAHTGKYSVKATLGLQAFRTELKANEHRGGRYKVSVWVDKANYTNARIHTGNGSVTFNGEIISAGDWVQLNHYFEVSTNAKTVFMTSNAGTIYFDDYRMSPIASSMKSYVYNDWNELTHILGANNLATQFEYDTDGRLVRTYQEIADNGPLIGGFKKYSENVYNYKKVVEIDANSNGVIDPVELYDPIFASLSISDPNSFYVTVTINTSGGSGNYEYRWAQGLNVNSLSYGNWGASNSISFHSRCPNGRMYYKCEVKDITTGVIVERTGNHLRNCDSGGGRDEILPDLREQ